MKYFRIFIILFSLFLLNGVSFAANWELAAVSGKKDAYYYIDATDIEIKGDTVIFWIKTENTDPFKFNGVKTWTAKYEYQVKNDLYRGSQKVYYYENGNSTNMLQADNWKELPYITPITSLTGAAIYKGLESKDWIAVGDNDAFYQPMWLSNELILWHKINNSGDTIYSLDIYRPSTKEIKTPIIVGSTPNDEFFKYCIAKLNTYYYLNPDSPDAELMRKAMDFVFVK